MDVPAGRTRAHFDSEGELCVAWHSPGTNGACVVMAGGFAVTKEAATDQFASAFNRAGFSVLAFDYRGLGESDGEPRLVLPIKAQLADWDAAIACAARLPEVDEGRVGIWGFSASGGLVLEVAARNDDVAAAVAQTPNADGLASLRGTGKYQTRAAMLRFTGIALLDAVGGLLRRPPRLVPLVGPPGTVAMLATPDALHDGFRALDPDGEHVGWRREVAARSALRLAFYRPGRHAREVLCPVLVLVCDDDRTAPPAPAVRAARRAPGGELFRMPGGHYEPFLEGHPQALDAEVRFLTRHLLGDDDHAVPKPVMLSP